MIPTDTYFPTPHEAALAEYCAAEDDAGMPIADWNALCDIVRRVGLEDVRAALKGVEHAPRPRTGEAV